MAFDYSKARPPESDSDDDYDGFMFGDNYIEKQKTVSHWAVDLDQELYSAARAGELDNVRKQIELLDFKVDEVLKGGLTLLHIACRWGHLDIVRYLTEDKHANVNKNIDSYTPLMLACDCTEKPEYIIEKIVLLLIKNGAAINASDKYGQTSFMRACCNGHVAIVRHVLKDVSLDAIDNQGCTAIFYAVENNHPEIVKILVDFGVNCNIANQKGYTPIQVAQFHGFYDLLEYLPRPKETYLVPPEYLSYKTLSDYIPRIFLKTECPEYFQEIYTILESLQLDRFLEYFAKGQVPLVKFLAMTDESLKELGIKQPIYRMKIMKGLLDFHLHHWCKKAIARVQKNSKENFYDILMLTANHLQHLVIITGTLRFIKNNLRAKTLGPLSAIELETMAHNLKKYRDTIKELRKTVKYLASFSPPKNPLYIDYDEYLAECKRTKLKSYFKYTIIISISVVIFLKLAFGI